MEKVDLDRQELINILNEIKHECISRSGLCPLDSTGGDGSTFDLIWVCCLRYVNINKSINEIKNDLINRFMILHHNIVLKRKKFNYNWD